MAAETMENFELLKTRTDQIDLKEMLGPHFTQLFDLTINTAKIAFVLLKAEVLNLEEIEQCLTEPTSFYQNLEMYKILMKKNCGRALIEALEITNNTHILQILQSDLNQSTTHQPKQVIEPKPLANLNIININNLDKIPVKDNKAIIAKDPIKFQVLGTNEKKDESSTASASASSVQSTSKQVSILLKGSQPQKSWSNKWKQTVGMNNLSRLDERNLNLTLARVAMTGRDIKSSRKFFNPCEFNAEEPTVIIKFLESQLEMNVAKKIMDKVPLEIYVNTRSFTNLEWESLSKLLYSDRCRASLENLWLDEVNYVEFYNGTRWMTTLNSGDKSYLWFPKLKVFIFEGPNGWIGLETLHRILVLIKTSNYSLSQLWNARCQVQIWRDIHKVCQILLDPIKGTVSLNFVEKNLKTEIEQLLKNQKLPGLPVLKLFCVHPNPMFLSNVESPHLLTHLFLLIGQDSSAGIIKETLQNLASFKRLEKLILWSDTEWPIDLKQLNVLSNLSFLYVTNAQLYCYGFGVDRFPWQPSVQTVILGNCRLKTADPESTLPYCMMVQRNRLQNDDNLGSKQYKIVELSNKQAELKGFVAFFN